MGYVLIGREASQFSGKARAALRWKGVEFRETVATPEVYRDIIEPRIGYSVIPLLLTDDGRSIQDTADIIDFADAACAGPSIHPPMPVQDFVSLLLELYADEWLVIPAMHYCWDYGGEWIIEDLGKTPSPPDTADVRTGVRDRRHGPRLPGMELSPAQRRPCRAISWGA